MKKIAVRLLFVPLAFFACAISIQAATATNERITVEAEGSGSTKMDALKDAWTVAVRQAVGMYLASRSETTSDGLNDAYTEQIAAYSRGQINSFKLLSESRANGIWTVKIRANVDKDILEDTIAASASKTIKIDGANLASQIKTALDKKQDALEVLEMSGLLDFSKCLDYVPSIVTFKIGGRPVVLMQHLLKVNLEKYMKQSAELEKLISSMSSKKFQVPLEQPLAKNAFSILRLKKYQLPSGFLKDLSKQEYLDNTRMTFTYPMDGHTRAGQPTLMAIHGIFGLFTIYNYDNKDKKNPLDSNSAFMTPTMAFLEIKEFGNSDTPWCFVTNSNRASCYEIEKGMGAIPLSNIFTLSFSVSSPEYPELAGSGASFTVVLPPVLNSMMSHQKNYFIAPELFIGYDDGSKISSNGNSSSYFTPIFIYYQHLDFDINQLAAVKSISGKYELSPISREMYPYN